MTNIDTPDRVSKQLMYFDMLAEIGITKHIGSLAATDEMLALCQVDAEAYVLDVGCGIGLTPCYIANVYGSRVVGVDITPKMIKRSKQEAERRGAADRTEFHVADAQDLPFDDNVFDAVIIESVNAFVMDLPKAFSEYLRVVKPGGFVGMNESTWLEPPTQEAVAYFAKLGARIRQKDEWMAVMVDAGLVDVVAHQYKVNIRQEARGRIKRFGIRAMLLAVSRTIQSLFRDPSTRAVLKEATQKVPGVIVKLMGYGVYVGRKTP